MTRPLGWQLPSSTFHTVLWTIALLVAAGISALIPPMASPDEMTHITRAYLISQGTVLMQPPGEGLPQDAGISARVKAFFSPTRVGGMVDKRLNDFVDVHSFLIAHKDRIVTPVEQKQLNSYGWTDAKSFYGMQGTGYYFPAIYAPQALALAIGQGLDLNLAHSYQLVRGLTLLACFAMLWLAFKLVPPNPWVAAILLLPMSVFQLLSPTLDGLTTSLAVLTVSLFLTAVAPVSRSSATVSWGLALCLFLLATSRTHLLPLLALPFFVAWQRQSRRDFYLGCGVAAGAIAWTLFALMTTSDLRIVRHLTTTQLLLFYAADPLAFFRVVWATLVDQFEFFKLSFIGLLGWLDTRLPLAYYPILWQGLGLCALASVSLASLREDWRARLLLLLLALASVALIFLALLVTWTPHPATMVLGVQGRYFVVPAILLGYVVSGTPTPQSTLRRSFSGLVLAGFAYYALSSLTMALVERYH